VTQRFSIEFLAATVLGLVASVATGAGLLLQMQPALPVGPAVEPSFDHRRL
jgi:hypothetical protein